MSIRGDSTSRRQRRYNLDLRLFINSFILFESFDCEVIRPITLATNNLLTVSVALPLSITPQVQLKSITIIMHWVTESTRNVQAPAELVEVNCVKLCLHIFHFYSWPLSELNKHTIKRFKLNVTNRKECNATELVTNALIAHWKELELA